jgi:hypothetical protein
MKLRFAVCLFALAFSACSPAPDTTAEAPAGGMPSAKRVALPDCAAVEAHDAGADGWKHPDCRLVFPDPSGLAIEARYAPAEDDSTEVTVQVVQTGDKTIQTFKERMGNTFNGPELVDFDKDGKVDIQLPLETGNVNTSWAIWRQVEDGKFVRIQADDLSGVELTKTDSGYIATQGRSSANEYYVSFYKLIETKLEPVATVSVIARGEPDNITGVDCAVDTDDTSPLGEGLTTKTAGAKFCPEPLVQDLIKDMAATPPKP